MSNPTTTDVHVDAALTDLSIGMGAQQYVWNRIAPVVPVTKQSDKYFIFDDNDARRTEGTAALRAPGGLANRIGWKVSNPSFFCDNYALGEQVPDEVKQNADAALPADQIATANVTERVNRVLEIQQASEVFAASKFATDVSGASSTTYGSDEVTYWNTYATSAPIVDVRVFADDIQKATGMRPNRMLMGREVFSTLLDHPDLIDRLRSTEDKMVQLRHIATLFELDEVIVGQASYNTAAEGGTTSNSFVHGKNALLYYTPASPGIMTPSAMYTFQWGPRSVLNYRDTPAGKKADVIEVHEYLDFVITATTLGCFFSAVVS